MANVQMLMVSYNHDYGKVNIDNHDYEDNITMVLVIPYIASSLLGIQVIYKPSEP